MATVTLRYWAAARDAAGCAEERLLAATLADALAQALASRSEAFAVVLSRSSYLVDGDPVGARPPESILLGDGAVVEVLPPFAGG